MIKDAILPIAWLIGFATVFLVTALASFGISFLVGIEMALLWRAIWSAVLTAAVWIAGITTFSVVAWRMGIGR